MKRIFLIPSSQGLWWRMYLLEENNPDPRVQFVGHIPNITAVVSPTSNKFHNECHRAPRTASVIKDLRSISEILPPNNVQYTHRLEKWPSLTHKGVYKICVSNDIVSYLYVRRDKNGTLRNGTICGPLHAILSLNLDSSKDHPRVVQELAISNSPGAGEHGLSFFRSASTDGPWDRIYASQYCQGELYVSFVGHVKSDNRPIMRTEAYQIFPRASVVFQDLIGIRIKYGKLCVEGSTDAEILRSVNNLCRRLRMIDACGQTIAKIRLAQEMLQPFSESYLRSGLFGPLSANLRLFAECFPTMRCNCPLEFNLVPAVVSRERPEIQQSNTQTQSLTL